jgi:hypothetical protein
MGSWLWFELPLATDIFIARNVNPTDCLVTGRFRTQVRPTNTFYTPLCTIFAAADAAGIPDVLKLARVGCQTNTNGLGVYSRFNRIDNTSNVEEGIPYSGFWDSYADRFEGTARRSWLYNSQTGDSYEWPTPRTFVTPLAWVGFYCRNDVAGTSALFAFDFLRVQSNSKWLMSP